MICVSLNNHKKSTISKIIKYLFEVALHGVIFNSNVYFCYQFKPPPIAWEIKNQPIIPKKKVTFFQVRVYGTKIGMKGEGC